MKLCRTVLQHAQLCPINKCQLRCDPPCLKVNCPLPSFLPVSSQNKLVFSKAGGGRTFSCVTLGLDAVFSKFPGFSIHFFVSLSGLSCGVTSLCSPSNLIVLLFQVPPFFSWSPSAPSRSCYLILILPPKMIIFLIFFNIFLNLLLIFFGFFF